MRTRLTVLLAFALVLGGLFTGVAVASGHDSGYGTTAAEYTLYADQDEPAGKVYVWDAFDDVYVQYVASHDWCFLETHVEVVPSLGDIPTTKQGNPIPGQFSQGESFSGCEFLAGHYVFKNAAAGGDVFVVAHAKMRDVSSTATVNFYSDGDGSTDIVSGPAGGVTTAVDAWEAFGDPVDTTPSYWDNALVGHVFSMGDWIWETYQTHDPTVTETVEFKHTFEVPGTPVADGTLYIANDNTYSAEMNAGFLGEQTDYTKWPFVGIYSFTAIEGTNTLEVTAGNYGNPSYTIDNNPAGLIFEGSVEYYDRVESAWAGQGSFDSKKWAYYGMYSPGDGSISDGTKDLTFLVFDFGDSSADLGGMAWIHGAQQYAVHTVCAEVAGDTAWFTYQIPEDAPSAPLAWVTFRVTDAGVVGYTYSYVMADMVDLCETQSAGISGGWSGTTSGEVVIHPGA